MRRPRILVVDDDAQFLRFVTELLTGAGYDARCAGDAFGALALAGEFAPDLVILDVSMPGTDGFELAQELGSSGRALGIPCLFVTGVPLREGAPPARAAGAVGYLEKPVRSATLLWTVKALLEAGDH